MTEIEDDRSETDIVGDETAGPADVRVPSEHEKRLRRELLRTREQVRMAQTERDAVIANAHRDRDVAVAEAKEDAKGRLIRSEMKAHAIRAGIVDLDGLRLADLSGVSVGDDGEIVGAEGAIVNLKDAKPYLFSAAATSPVSAGHLHRAPAPATPRAVDARTLSREEWQAERARLIGRPRAG